MLPVVALLAIAGGFWAYNTLPFIAEDCYFYAIIARNLALRGVQSYWGTELTNGVHPLWTLTLGGYSWIVSKFSTDALYHGGFGIPLVLALLGFGAYNWRIVARKAQLPAALLIFPQLVYLSIFGVLYSEAHLAFFAHSLLARLACDDVAEERGLKPVFVGLAAAAVFLARLDNVFYVAAFSIWYAVHYRSLRKATLMLGACAIPALVYVTVNATYFGGLTPISGYLKSTFPIPFVQGLRFLGGPAIMLSGYSVPFGWFPLALGAVVARLTMGRLRGPQTLLYPLLAGTACHAVYTGFFTAGFTDWYWYYVLPIVLLAWSGACLLRRFSDTSLDTVAQWAAVAVLAAAMAAVRLHSPNEGELPALRTLRVAKQLGIDHSVLLISEWPGTIGFYTKNEVIAADMLTSNRMLLDRLRHSGNAFDTVFDEARRKGTPVQYVFYNGGIFLRPDSDLSSVRYMDPKMADNVKHTVVGEKRFGPPVFADGTIAVWLLANH